jgi:hypothetical protein
MRMKLKNLAAASPLILLLAAGPALAQTSPGFVKGQVPTAAQWNGYFAGKQDYPAPGGGGNAVISPATGNVVGHALGFTNTTTGTGDLGYAPALQGIGGIRTTSPTITAAQFNTQCPFYTVNANSLNFALPAASTLQANGGCLIISNPSAFSATVTPNGTDTLNGVNAALSLPPGTLSMVSSDSGSADFMPVPVSLASANVWLGKQTNFQKTLTISGSTFTPDGLHNSYKIVLTGADTVANPAVASVAGSPGDMLICQDATGSRTITWGSQYYAQGGVASIVLSTGANVCDLIGTRDIDATHTLISVEALNWTH